MAAFRDRYLSARVNEPLRIVDVGSLDVNGTYRPLFATPPWTYIGVDMAAGPNVDLVLRTPYVWREILTDAIDVVISGQAFEHIPFFWITMLEIARVLKPDGLCCILAPSSGPEHRYPVDCWRFYPDGMRALADFARLDTVEAVTQWENTGDEISDAWHDTTLVCRKPLLSAWASRRDAMRRRLQHRAMTIGMRQVAGNVSG
jgi:SAM-dependent methyltransferase